MQFILLIVEYRNVLVATHNMTGVSEYPLYLWDVDSERLSEMISSSRWWIKVSGV